MDDVRRVLKFASLILAVVANSALAGVSSHSFFKNSSQPAKSFVQSGLATFTNTQPANCTWLSTFPISASGAGNSIIVGIASNTTSSANINWVMDNAGNIYAQVPSERAQDTTNEATELWITGPTLSGATQISICSNQFNQAVAAYYAEIKGYWDIDAVASTSNGNNVTVAAANVTGTTNYDLFVCMGAGHSNLTSIKAGNTFTPLAISTIYDMAYLFPGTTGSYGAAWTQASSTKSAVSTVAFKPGYTGLYSFVQQAFSYPGTNASSLSATFPGGQTATNLNIVSIGWRSSTGTVSSVSDSKGNTYQLAIGPTRGTGVTGYIYYATNILGAAVGSNTVTVNFSGSVTTPDLSIFEYRGSPNTTLDAAASSTTTQAGSTVPITTNNNQDLLFASSIADGFQGGMDWTGNAFRGRQQNHSTSDIMGDLITTSAGSYSASFAGPGSYDTVDNIVAFTDGTQPQARWIQVAEKSGDVTGSSFPTNPFTTNTTSGNTVICSIAFDAGGITVSSVTDNAGNTYTRAIRYNTGLQMTGSDYEIWYKSGITGGSGVVITANLSSSLSSAFTQISCHEFSGLQTSGALDQTMTASGASNPSVGPITTTYSKELVFGYLCSCGTVTAGSGFATRSNIDGDLVESVNLNGITSNFYLKGVSGSCYDGIAATFKSN